MPGEAPHGTLESRAKDLLSGLIQHQRMPSDLALKTMNRVHRIVLGATGGRLGWSVSGMPVIELTTMGRRSGQPRSTMLTSPYQEGSMMVIVGYAEATTTIPRGISTCENIPR